MAKLKDEDILDSYEAGEWQSIDKLQREVCRYQDYASTWLDLWPAKSKSPRQLNIHTRRLQII